MFFNEAKESLPTEPHVPLCRSFATQVQHMLQARWLYVALLYLPALSEPKSMTTHTHTTNTTPSQCNRFSQRNNAMNKTDMGEAEGLKHNCDNCVVETSCEIASRCIMRRRKPIKNTLDKVFCATWKLPCLQKANAVLRNSAAYSRGSSTHAC